MNALKLLGLSLILAGCTQQSAQDSRSKVLTWHFDGESLYRDEAAKKVVPALARIGMPDAVQEDFIDCFWQTFSHGLTPDQKAAFDAAARNEGDITPAMENEIVDKMQTSFHTKGDFSAMEPYCHDKILEFKKYVQQ